MVTIVEWLKTKDYGIGLAQLTKYSKNRIMLQSLSRKQNPEKLEYELRKIAKEKGIDLTKSAPEPEDVDLDETGKVTDLVPGKDQESQSHSDQVIDQMNADKLKVVRDGREVKYEDLSMELKARWNQNRDGYKEIRTLHEKLKLMENATPEDRQPLTQRICDLDDKIRDNWAEIDAREPASNDSAADAPGIDHKRIQSNRKYISTNLKKLPEQQDPVKAAKVVTELQVRYDELKKAGETVTQETVGELIKAGVQC